MRLYFALMIAALVVVALSGVALAWDGSYALFHILDPQSAAVSYGRWTQIPLHWLVLEASRLTSSMEVLRAMFGLAYGTVTLLALAASWWMVHDRAEARPLFIWAAFGIGLGTLPGQVCAVCQATLSVQLFYPILLAILLLGPRRTFPVAALCAIAILFFHPSAMALLALGAGIAFVIGLRFREARPRMWHWGLALAALAALAMVRFMLSGSAYETGELSPQIVRARFFQSLAGLPLAALGLAWVAGALLLIQPLVPRARRFPFLARVNPTLFSLLPFLFTGGAGLLLLLWAADPHRWAEEVNFREMGLFAAVPFVLLATLEGLAGPAANLIAVARQRMRLVQLTGLVFFLVLSAQSWNWIDLTDRLREAIRTSPDSCVAGSGLTWLTHTPLEHWSLGAYSLIIQERQPDKVVLPGDTCTEESFTAGLPVAIFGPGDWDIRDWDHGWFDLHLLRSRVTARENTAPDCQFPLAMGWYGIEHDGADWHRWMSGQAGARVLLAHDTGGTLRGEIVSLYQPNQVDILVNGTPSSTVHITEAGWHAFGPLTLSLRAGENVVEFVSHEPPGRVPGDSRLLAVAIRDPALTLQDGTLLCRTPGAASKTIE